VFPSGRDCATTDLPPGFRKEVVAAGLTVPTSFAFHLYYLASKFGDLRRILYRG